MPDPNPREQERPDGPTIVLDNELRPQAIERGCPSSVVAHLNVAEPVRVWCAGIEGHEGDHYFRIEWTTP